MYNSKTIFYTLLAIAFGVFVLSSLIVYKNNEIKLSLELKLTEQKQLLLKQAIETDEYEKVTGYDNIVKDCSSDSKNRFDALLNNLGGLNKAELIEIEPLFNACASYLAQKKSLTVLLLEQEYAEYISYVEIYKLVASPVDVLRFDTETWHELVKVEVERQQLVTELVEIQNKIIQLLKNSPTDTENIESLVVRAQQIRTQTGNLNAQVAELHTKLISI